MAVPRCISVEPPTYTESPIRSYDVTLGDKMVTDTMVALIYKAILEAIKNSGKEGPRAAQPGLAGFYLVLNKVAGQESRIVITVRGELSAAARTLNVGGGRPTVLQEKAPSERIVCTYVYVPGMGDDEAARMAVRDGLLKKVGHSTLGVEVSGDRERRQAGVRGAFLIKSDEIKQRAVIGEMYQVDDTESAKNMGYTTLSKEEASNMMVAGSDVKLVTASSPSYLALALDKMHITYQEWNGAPGGNSSATQAEIASLREMITEQQQAAEERQAAADAAFAQVSERAATESRQLRQAMEGSKAQVAALGDQLKQARRVMQRAEESAGLRAEMEAAKSDVRDAEMRGMVQRMAGAMSQQGALLAALANANPNALQALQGQQQGMIGMAPNVVGTNANGAPVIDLGALTGMGAEMQGGGAAIPPTAEVEAARQAAEEAAAEFDKARTRLSRAWTGESSSASEGGSSEGESEGGNTVSPEEEVDEEVELEYEDELQEAMDAEATAAGPMEGDDPATGALLFLVGHGTAGWGHGDGLAVAWGGLYGYYNYFECNGILWLPRSLSVAEEEGMPYDGVRVMMGDGVAGLEWCKHMTYAYFRRMQRLLGRQFASEHKAKRKKYIGATEGTTTMGGVGSTWWTMVGKSGRMAVGCTAGLVGLGLGGLMLGRNLGMCNNFDLQHVVTPPGRIPIGGMVACNSELLLLQQRNGVDNVTAGHWATVAGSRGIGSGGELGLASLDGRLVDSATADGHGQTWWDADRDDEARGALRVGGESDAHTGDVDIESGQRLSWAGDVVEYGDGEGTRIRRESVAPVGIRARARATVWWQVQGGAPPDSTDESLWTAAGRGRHDVQEEGAGEWAGMLWIGGLLGIIWGSLASISRKERRDGMGGGKGGRWEGRGGRRWANRLLDRWAQTGTTLVVLLMRIHACEANEDDSKERMMLFNTRGLAVSTSTVAVAAGAGYFFARAALDKLAFIATTLSTKGIEAGVLLELICDLRQAKWLGRWFRNRGYGLRVASGEACEMHGRRGVRNSVAVFYQLSKFKELKGESSAKYKKCGSDNSVGAATKLGERMLAGGAAEARRVSA